LTEPPAGAIRKIVGGVISPLLSNLYMRRFVKGWKTGGHEKRLSARIVNYADDCAPRRCERTTSGVSSNAMLCER
jgi:hypothetical protein